MTKSLKTVIKLLLAAVLIAAAFWKMGLFPIIMRKEVCVNGRWYKTDTTYELKISDCTEKSIKNLKYLTSLKTLWLDPDETIENIDFLSEMSELETLSLFNCNVKDWSKLQNCKKLKTFYGINLRINDFKVLSELPELEEVTVETIFNNVIITDFSGIEKLKGLKSLSVTCSASDLSPLAECKELTSLSLFTIDPVDLTQLEQLKNLKELEIWQGKNIEKNMSMTGLLEFNNLSEITLSNISSNDFEILLDMENLECLRLVDCTISDEIIQALREKNVSVKLNIDAFVND